MTESRALNDDLSDAVPSRDGAVVRIMHICNEKGLHARASAKFVQTVEKFDADVRVTWRGETVGGKSILGLMMLGAGPGSDITVDACGKDAEAVMAALDALICGRFGEEE
jgi:phosphocarrier protein